VPASARSRLALLGVAELEAHREAAGRVETPARVVLQDLAQVGPEPRVGGPPLTGLGPNE
jgi:hypothetical protein